MRFGSLFSGIGGLDLGLERAGMECAWQVEIDDYCNKVLEKHWPTVPRYRDVREFPPRDFNAVELIALGFPCQDVSQCGLGAGLYGERSRLWFQGLRIIRIIRPKYVLIENVAALLVRGIDRVLCDLSASGFDAEWRVLSGCEFGAPQTRERLFIIAYPNALYGSPRVGDFEIRQESVFSAGATKRDGFWIQAPDFFAGVDAGSSGEFYRQRAEACGNTVLPQIAEWIGRRIMEAESCRQV